MGKISQFKLILYISIFYILFDNFTFFKNVVSVYPIKENWLFLISLATVLLLVLVFVFNSISSKYTTNPLLIIVTLISSAVAYFAN